MGSYYTILSAAESLLKVEGSKFIAEASSIYSAAEAEGRLTAARKRHFDATHHCYAYAVGEDRALFHYSDDGEPSGTAGIKIFSSLQARDLSDVIIIVTRYFGGTKLGVGGLGRAYHDAAEAVLAQTRTVLRLPVEQITAIVEYTYITPVKTLAHRAEAVIDSTVYTEAVTFSIFVPLNAADGFERQLVDITNGTAVVARGIRTIRTIV